MTGSSGKQQSLRCTCHAICQQRPLLWICPIPPMKRIRMDQGVRMRSHLSTFLLLHIGPERYLRLYRKRFRHEITCLMCHIEHWACSLASAMLTQEHAPRAVPFPLHAGVCDVWFQSPFVHPLSGRKHLFISDGPEEMLLDANALTTHSWRRYTLSHRDGACVTLQWVQLWWRSMALVDLLAGSSLHELSSSW